MFQEIKDYLHLLQSDSQEKQKRNFGHHHIICFKSFRSKRFNKR
jgi:hypothetical protein